MMWEMHGSISSPARHMRGPRRAGGSTHAAELQTPQRYSTACTLPLRGGSRRSRPVSRIFPPHILQGRCTLNIHLASSGVTGLPDAAPLTLVGRGVPRAPVAPLSI